MHTTPRPIAAALSFLRSLTSLASLALLSACAVPRGEPPPPLRLPEGATGNVVKEALVASRHLAVTAHPLASDAALQILREGGSALDAAIAAQMVLGLVEPQSSGIGGGALLMHWDGVKVQAWDGRETAPAAADERLLLGADGKPLPFTAAAVGGLAVGVPGAVRMLETVHRQHGTLPWARLFEPAIRLADEGFAVSPRLHTLLAADPHLRRDAQARALYYGGDGQPHAVGHRLRNPALAAVLRRIAADGSAALHGGPIAADIVARVRGHAGNAGRMAAADLAGYTARERTAICTDWKAYRICGFPPPSSGHLALMQILGVMGHRPPTPMGLQDGLPGADWLHGYTEAARLAYADRAVYVADPDFVAPPAGRWTSLLDEPYLKQRAGLVGEQSLKVAPAGQPRGEPIAWAPQAEQAEYGTSHLSIVDAQGRAVALTTSIEAVFGARLMSDGGTGLAGGFLLNNQLTDFSFEPADQTGRLIANRVQPGKRPRSSMTPTLVFDRRDGRLLMTLGSPLGPVIPHLVAKTLLAALDGPLGLQEATALANFGSFNGPTVLETGRFPLTTLQALRQRGHDVVESELPSGIHAIVRFGTGWLGAADPRREGQARGD